VRQRHCSRGSVDGFDFVGAAVGRAWLEVALVRFVELLEFLERAEPVEVGRQVAAVEQGPRLGKRK